MVEVLRVGTVLFGFCGGWFGRDSYDDKRVEAIGVDWVVARHLGDGSAVFAQVDPDLLVPYSRPEAEEWTRG
jgi:hypothetical protein